MTGEVEIRDSNKARHLRISVHPDGSVLVTKPLRISLAVAQKFIQEKSDWIESAQEKFKALREKRKGREPIVLPKPRKNSKAYKEARDAARTLVTERLAHFNQMYGFRYGTISIRNQKTRWGSCSAANNLSFNYRIVFLPAELADYVIVHELCHTKEHNHSAMFWALVSKAVPDHIALRRALRNNYV